MNPIRKSRRRQFVDQPVNCEARQLTSAPRGLTLFVIEIRGHRNDRGTDGRFEVMLSVSLDACEYQSREFFGQKFSLSQTSNAIRTHVALEGRGRQSGMRDLAFARSHADEQLPIVVDTDCGRCQHLTKTVWNELRSTVPPDGYCCIGCP